MYGLHVGCMIAPSYVLHYYLSMCVCVCLCTYLWSELVINSTVKNCYICGVENFSSGQAKMMTLHMQVRSLNKRARPVCGTQDCR